MSPASAQTQLCMYNDRECTVEAYCDIFWDETRWAAYCDDGYVDGGIISGNELPNICGF